MAAPRASIALACSCSVAPRNVSGAGFVSAIATAATAGLVTETLAAPLLAPLAACRVAVPMATAVTRPCVSAVTTPGALELQVKTASGIAVPRTSSEVACSWAVAPTLANAATLVSTICTLAATGTRTVRCASADTDPLLASRSAPPTPSAVARPALLTDATPALLDDQVIGAPASTCPSAAATLALSCTVTPRSKLALAGVIAIRVAGGPASGMPASCERPPLPPHATARLTPRTRMRRMSGSSPLSRSKLTSAVLGQSLLDQKRALPNLLIA